jgi:hypothetical protein
MTPEQHREKAERIRRSTDRVDIAVYEMVIEGAYLAAMHWFNFGLHAMAVTEHGHDVVHGEHLSGIDRGKIVAIAPEPLAGLDEIETFRARFVRGTVAGGDAAARRALAIHDAVRAWALAAAPYVQRES